MSEFPDLTTPTADGVVDPLRIAVIVGSIRTGRAGAPIAHWFVEQTKGHRDLTIDLVDLAEPQLPVVLPDFDAVEVPATVTELGERLGAADGFVVITPEYNHSFPASLKNAIDWFHAEWFAKPVAFVSYGGRGQGIRATEQLRQVFAELHAVTTRDAVGIDLDDVDDAGCPNSSGIDGAAKVLLDQLVWWGETLRAGRRARPYVA